MGDNPDRWAAECFRRGNDAIQNSNWDLAIEMFGTCVKLKPANPAYRQLLRNSTKKKYKENGSGVGKFGIPKLMGIRSKVKKAIAKEEWEEASKIAEEGLLLNPWDVQLNVYLAEASQPLDREAIARFSYFEACKASPKDKQLWATFGEFLRERGEIKEAIEVWQKILQMDPNDLNTSRKLTNLQAELASVGGGYEDAKNAREVATNRAAPSGRPGQTMAPGESEENDLRHAIRREPEKIEHYLKLATHLRGSKKYEESLGLFDQSLEISNNDPGILEQREDTELLMMKHQLEETREKADKSGDEDARKQVATLVNALRDRRIEILNTRVERYPANLNLKLELGQLMMQVQNWPRAIKLLQVASNDPRLKTKALVSLGKCFIYEKKLSLARGQFEKAVPELNPDNEPATFMECHYLLGCICEELGDIEAAEQHLGEVLARDYEYKDAEKRHTRLQGG